MGPNAQLVGRLLYLEKSVRPDISLAVGLLARFCSEPKFSHWIAVKRFLRYLKKTLINGSHTHRKLIRTYLDLWTPILRVITPTAIEVLDTCIN